MPQINRYLYFEIDDGLSPVRVVGDRYVPKTIALTGPAKVEKRLESLDTTTSGAQILNIGASGDIAGYDFLAIRSSAAGDLSWVGTTTTGNAPAATSSINVLANEWVVFLGDDTRAHGDDTAIDRLGNAAEAITGFWIKTGGVADIDVLAYT